MDNGGDVAEKLRRRQYIGTVQEEETEAEAGTQRVEAFSDGVFAIAITLLILEIKVPQGLGDGPRSLAAALRALWPFYLTYILTFVTVGIYWANHNYVFRLYKKTDHLFNLLNVFFLMCISFVPLPTAVLGEYIALPHQERAAVIFYAIGFWLCAFSWYLIWLYAGRRPGMIDPRLAPAFVQFLGRQYLLSIVLYTIALVVAFVSSAASLAVTVGLTSLYLLPPRKPVYQSEEIHDHFT